MMTTFTTPFGYTVSVDLSDQNWIQDPLYPDMPWRRVPAPAPADVDVDPDPFDLRRDDVVTP
jgi:hypothetical protein